MTTHKRFSSRKSIQNSDPGKILDLVISLNNDSCSQLQTFINTYLEDECSAEVVFQVIVHSDRMEGYVEAVGKNDLSKKYKLQITQCLSEVLKTNTERVEYVCDLPTELVDIIYPFLKDDFQKKRVMMYPVIDKPFTNIVCIVGFSLAMETVSIVIRECYLFSWPALKKAICLDYETNLKQKCQQLLKVARRLFSQVASLETLLRIAMDQAKNLTKAAFCVVFLVDIDANELVDSCTDRIRSSHETDEVVERRFPLNLGITGQVLKYGTAINLKDASSHPSFNSAIDGYPGRECRQLLCFPIREQTGIIGVGQLINKVGNPYFDALDEEVCLAFSIYCGVCIVHSVVYQKIKETHIRNTLANELVMYHMKVSDSEVARVLDCTGFHNHPHLTSLHFNPRVLPLRELPCYVLKMFADVGFLKKFNIKPSKLVCFILYVKKGYRDVPYHGWTHAFNVVQWAYAAINHFRLLQQGYFSDLQGLMYLVAALVHDLDHRGTTNSFQILGQTTLSALYSSEGSVMERHHLAQAICILNTEGCDILENLPRKDYDRALMLLKDYVLATDLSNFFKNLNEYKTIAMDFQKGNKVHIAALQCLLMNAADLSDQLKDWGSVKKTAAAVLTEFFKQGDQEKSLGEFPAHIMDRDKCFIPDLEIQFITSTCVPLFDTLGRMLPKAATCTGVLFNYIEKWEASKPVFAEKKDVELENAYDKSNRIINIMSNEVGTGQLVLYKVPPTAGLSVLLSPELDNLIEVNLKEMEQLRLEEEKERANEKA